MCESATSSLHFDRRVQASENMKTTNTTCDEDVKEFNGDGLRIQLDNNELRVKISGDGCKANVTRNSGKIHIIGDGCCLNVKCNSGDIVYEGDGGHINLGRGSKIENVSYVGHGGKIICEGKIVGARKFNGHKKTHGEKSASDPELDNAINERKEANNALYFTNAKKKLLRRSKTIVIPERTCELSVNVNSNTVEHWFKYFTPPNRSVKSRDEKCQATS